MTDIKWQTPPSPASGPGSTKWAKVFAELRQRPNEWALVQTNGNRALAQNVRRGSLGGAKAGEFEATCRKSADGNGVDTYLRYVGEVSA